VMSNPVILSVAKDLFSVGGEEEIPRCARDDTLGGVSC
jgi:hypothetical protein